MKLVAAVIAAVTGVAGPMQLWAQDVFPDVEYIQGRTGLSEKIKGKLIIGSAGVEFRTKNDSAVFTVPLETIKDVTNSLQTDPGSVGRKLMLGVFSSKREEFLYLNTETAERAEAIVFKCHKKNTSPDMMAKIKFQLAKAKPVAADTAKMAAADTTKPR
jgi:hypothetical protein